MGYKLDMPEKLDLIFDKLSRKNKQQLDIINKKIDKILENPHQFKPLTGNMKGIRRK